MGGSRPSPYLFFIDMELGIFTEVISLIFGGSIGAFLMQIYTAKVNKKKLEAEALKAKVSAEHEKLDCQQDAFDTMYQQLNKCMADYSAIAEEYRNHREKMRVYEEQVQQQIHAKCLELAALKSKITYLKGIRCYDTLCKNRIKFNPDKPQPASEDQDSN